jgi:ferrochelatase
MHLNRVDFDFQADALKIALKEKNLEADIYVGMRYWYPFTEEAINQVKTPPSSI